jgi:sugar phosphate isomerase/epimerase
MTLSIGISSGALYPRTLTEDAPAAGAAWGVRTIELMLQTAGEYDPGFMVVVEANARAAGIQVSSLHTGLYHPVSASYARRIDEGRTQFRRAVEAAHRLGAHAIVWHGATKQEMGDPETWGRFLAQASDFAGWCGEAGVALAIENVS